MLRNPLPLAIMFVAACDDSAPAPTTGLSGRAVSETFFWTEDG